MMTERHVLRAVIAAAMLVCCGGSQPLIDADSTARPALDGVNLDASLMTMHRGLTRKTLTPYSVFPTRLREFCKRRCKVCTARSGNRES